LILSGIPGKGQKLAVATKSAQPSNIKMPIVADKPTGPNQALPKVEQKELDDVNVPGAKGDLPGNDTSSNISTGAMKSTSGSQPEQNIQGLAGPVPPPGFVSLSKYVPMKGITPLTSQAQSTRSQLSGAVTPSVSADLSQEMTGTSTRQDVDKLKEADKESKMVVTPNYRETADLFRNVTYGFQNQHSDYKGKKTQPPRKKTKIGESTDDGEKPEKLIVESDDDVPVLTHDLSSHFTAQADTLQSGIKPGIKLVLRSTASESSDNSKFEEIETSTAPTPGVTDVVMSVSSVGCTTVTSHVENFDILPPGRTIPVLMNRSAQKPSTPNISVPPPVESVPVTIYTIPTLGSTPKKITATMEASSPISVVGSHSSTSMIPTISPNSKLIPSGSNLRSVPMMTGLSSVEAAPVGDLQPQAPVTGPAAHVTPIVIDIKKEPTSPSPVTRPSNVDSTSIEPVPLGDIKKEHPEKVSGIPSFNF
jgi:hypothetical protein